jgi:hypothetical protein
VEIGNPSKYAGILMGYLSAEGKAEEGSNSEASLFS